MKPELMRLSGSAVALAVRRMTTGDGMIARRLEIVQRCISFKGASHHSKRLFTVQKQLSGELSTTVLC